MTSHKQVSVLTNHGLAKFPIQQTSEYLHKNHHLYGTVGGVLLSSNSFLRRYSFSKRLTRVAQRSTQLSSSRLIHNSYLGELLWQAYLFGRILHLPVRVLDAVQSTSFKFVDLKALRTLKNALPGEIDVYHCRSGFGAKSIKYANELGIATVCEHTTAHPDFKEAEIEKTGKRLLKTEELMKLDLESAQHILVPSNWVMNTFKKYADNRKITILTPPLNSEFRNFGLNQESKNREIDVLFVGHVSKLKGIYRLYSIAINLAPTIKISIAGTWDPKYSDLKDALNKRMNISILDYVEHGDVANLMKSSKVFFFPSLIEGAARVIDEATYSGCLVFATSASFADDNQKAIYIDDLEDSEIVAKIEKFVNDSPEREKYALEAFDILQSRNNEYYPKLIELYSQFRKRRNSELRG